MSKLHALLKRGGPGLITGAADDDPSGIATYTQAGAQFGFGQLWTVLFAYPLMTAVQEACARLGAVKGKGLAGIISDHYNKKIVYAVVTLVAIANTINIGADIGAMAAAANLLIPVSFSLLTLIFAALMLILEIFTSYKMYAKILKWLALALFAYPLTAIIATHHWKDALFATVVPHVEFSPAFLFLITGVIGTTISPYMFFWQASEEVEEEVEKGRLSSPGAKPTVTDNFIKNIRIDTAVGMATSQITTWFIIVVAASVLHTHGITNIATAADAAKAIEPLVSGTPISGFLAKFIFAIGIIGLGLLAVPVLAGSASYAISEAFSWKEGLYLKLRSAHGFYGVITIATLLGLGINFIGIDPMKALIFTAVINAVAAVPLLFFIAKLSGNGKIMGKYKNSFWSNLGLWATFIAMLGASVAMIISFVH